MPDWKQIVRDQLANTNLEPTTEAEIVDEVAQHLEDRYQALRNEGVNETEAYVVVIDELSESELLLEELRRMRRMKVEPASDINNDGRRRFFGDLRQDVRYGFRTLRRQPGFTLVAILTLALGIGANTAIFSVVNGVLLKPLGFHEPERLLMIWTDNPSYQLGFHEFPAANSDLPEWRATATSFEEIAGYQSTSAADLSEDGDPERVGAVEVTANLMTTLGIQPLIGRNLSVQEEQPGHDQVAIISYDLWQRRYGGVQEILGKTITVNQVRRQIIAVMPKGFNFPRATDMPRAYNLPEKTELWMPLARDASYWQKRMQRGLGCLIARLKPGVTAAQAQSEMDKIAANQAMSYPDTHKGWRVWLTPLFNQVIGPTRMPLLVLLSAVGLLLLIACANITSLLLAKGASRRREIAVRAAIGAGRSRIIRQLLTESVLLGLLGGVCGLLFGYWGLHVLLMFIPASVPRLQEVSLDSQVFLFTAFISLITGVLFGVVPAWQASKLNLVEALKNSTTNYARARINNHSVLVGFQIALVAVLLVGAILMLKSFRRLLAVDPGFRPQGVATFQVALPWSRYSNGTQREQFYRQAQSRLKSLPGVHQVGAISRLPLAGSENMNYIAVEGAEPVPRGQEPLAEDRVITPGYFDAMGVSFVSGRDLNEADGPDKPPIAIVNETLARKFFPNGDAIGRRLKWVLDDREWRTIVGIVRDVRGHAIEVEARPQIYYPFAESPLEDSMSFAIRADASALPSLHHTIRQELKQLDPTIPAADFRTMPELFAQAVARPRFSSLLLNLLAALALLLAFVGLYGVMAHRVTQRTREIGIRMAVGARQRDVLALIISQGMRPALIGIVIGLSAAFAFTRVLASQLYEVSPTDPATFALVALGLLTIALAACYIPARRATQIDPVNTLRFE